MSRKKIEVVELNKKEDKILLAEEQSALILFWRRHGLLIYLTLLILSLSIVGISLFSLFKNMDESVEPKIKNATIDMSLGDYHVTVLDDSLTDEAARQSFLKDNILQINLL